MNNFQEIYEKIINSKYNIVQKKITEDFIAIRLAVTGEWLYVYFEEVQRKGRIIYNKDPSVVRLASAIQL